ncbi:hypothetical protein DSM25559_3705 [Agrobacterium rosae]|uniref:Uncharacterized protein n=1 Tax=Agrobacterium rosae TaxID=1972867 RepID=A0A1R3TZP3_9HYPH|nr:hypothetical protein DSM25559_3705 [Agrobacterium rosae]
MIVGPPGVRKSEASPSDEYLPRGNLAARRTEFAAKIYDTRGRTVMERWTILKQTGTPPNGRRRNGFRSLAKTPLKGLKK